jgi:hypothetical protein
MCNTTDSAIRPTPTSNTKLTINIMQLRNLPRILSLEHNLEIPFVKTCHRRQLGSRKLGQRVQVQAIHDQANSIQDNRRGNYHWQRGQDTLGSRLHGSAQNVVAAKSRRTRKYVRTRNPGCEVSPRPAPFLTVRRKETRYRSQSGSVGSPFSTLCAKGPMSETPRRK